MWFIVFLVACFTSVLAMEKDVHLFARPFGFCDGSPLTCDVVQAWAPRLSEDEEELIGDWLVSHPELIERLIVQDVAPSERISKCVETKEWLDTQEDLKNLARSNFIFEDPSGKYVIKISSYTSRLQNQIMAAGIPAYFTKVSPEVLEQVAACDTFQTVSYIPTFLRYQELKQDRGLDHLHVPETFLMHVPGRPQELCDSNYVIVQKKDDLLRREDVLARLPSLTKEQIYETVLLIFYCALWNMRTNLQIGTGGTIIVNDLEQPNVTSPEGFYLQEVRRKKSLPFFGKARFKRNVEAGIRELYELFDPAGVQAQWIKECSCIIAGMYNKNLKTKIIFVFPEK